VFRVHDYPHRSIDGVCKAISCCLQTPLFSRMSFVLIAHQGRTIVLCPRRDSSSASTPICSDVATHTVPVSLHLIENCGSGGTSSTRRLVDPRSSSVSFTAPVIRKSAVLTPKSFQSHFRNACRARNHGQPFSFEQ
jgi:hypothetical protein